MQQRPLTERFPTGRAFIALLVTSVLTPLVWLSLGMLWSRPDLHELMMLPVAAIMYAWPGALVFLVLGLPTAYWLFRLNRASLLIFAFFGAAYTALPWVILHVVVNPPRAKFLDLVPTSVVVGLLNGVLTRLILLGRR